MNRSIESSAQKGVFLVLVLLGVCAVHPGSLLGQQIVYVDTSAAGMNDGTSWADAFVDLQDALVPAVSGTEIWVAAGTYTPGPPGAWTATFELKNGVSLYGGFAGLETLRSERDPGLRETILSGDIDGNDTFGITEWDGTGWNGNRDNSFHVVTGSGTNKTAVLDGFTVTGGATNYGGHVVPFGDLGSGMLNIGGSPTVASCIFRRNVASYGAGMYSSDGSPSITGCAFVENNAEWYKGAGLFNASSGTVTVTGCLFRNNKVLASFGQGAGAAISNDRGCVLRVTGCRFVDNLAENINPIGDPSGTPGAAIYNLGDGLVVAGCTFERNRANAGGAIYTEGSSTVVNSLFVDNTVFAYPAAGGVDYGGFGAGIANASPSVKSTRIISCTFANNHAGEGAGVTTTGQHGAILFNSILWGNNATGSGVSKRGAQIKGETKYFASCVEGLFDIVPGEPPPNPKDFPGCIDGDPLLADLAGNDGHLTIGSPCVNAGWPHAILPATDFEGDPRSVSGAVDMGADEFALHLYHRGVIVPGRQFEIKVVGFPGAAPVTLALGATLADPPVTTQFGALFLDLPALKTIAMGTIPPTGVLSVSSRVPSWWAPGKIHPIQALVGPPAPGSKLTNLHILEVDP